MSLPPAQPVYILKGHASAIHSAAFIRANTRLMTGDADGWVVLWSLETRRSAAVWRAHDSVILGLAAWGSERLITHGRDNKLIVWRLRQEDESSLSTALPVDDTVSTRKQPWLVHILGVNTLNFCSFSHCNFQGQFKDMEVDTSIKQATIEELLIAVPNAKSSEAVDIFHLPSERRVYTVLDDTSAKTGMVMAVAVFYHNRNLTVVVGYESGHAMVTQQVDGHEWQILYMSRSHSQPVLSLDLNPTRSFFITSSADAVIAKHPIPTVPHPAKPSPAPPAAGGTSKAPSSSGALLSQCLAVTDPCSSKGKGKGKGKDASPSIEIQTTPLHVSSTKHAGQQGLRIRSDGKILATAGWGARVRVYSVSSLRELAVLKWHKEGCYALAFARLPSEPAAQGSPARREPVAAAEGQSTDLAAPGAGVTTLVKQQRVLKATTKHWLAAGSKDGKVSLWEIY